MITRFRDRVVTNEAKDAIRDYFGKKVFNIIIPENIKLEEAHNAHLPIYKYDKKSKGTTAYAQMAKEIMKSKSKNNNKNKNKTKTKTKSSGKTKSKAKGGKK